MKPARFALKWSSPSRNQGHLKAVVLAAAAAKTAPSASSASGDLVSVPLLSKVADPKELDSDTLDTPRGNT
ncbi:hypothetical protein CTA1_4574 [Colletotrichum tanaceti]|uniref:Uncharacterized protein n=1 Tax=Colletotrichum tanaceti TaxID=1306861 RepID=A0A4U6XCB7_9PEZI|nr:hypothetical protein CTA1_4574 [Colletotrichum tanaceti]